MKVSVLVPAFNADAFLPFTLQTVREQDYSDWELIVVEDGSVGATERIVHEFAGRNAQPVRYENLGVNRGVSAARNRLLALAKGDVLAFLDSDDQWTPSHLSSLVQCLSQGHALACSGIELWDSVKEQSLGEYAPKDCWLNAPRKSLLERSFIQTSSCVAFPRATAVRTGSFDEELRIGEDRDYWFRSFEGGGTLGFTGQVTCRYSKHPGSSMSGTLRVAEDTVRFFQKHQNAHDVPRRVLKSYLSSALRVYGRLLRSQNYRLAAKVFLEAWLYRPFAIDLPLRAIGVAFPGIRGKK